MNAARYLLRNRSIVQHCRSRHRQRLEVDPVLVSEVDELDADSQALVLHRFCVSHLSSELERDDDALTRRLFWIGVE
jgi:hypothetical protein